MRNEKVKDFNFLIFYFTVPGFLFHGHLIYNIFSFLHQLNLHLRR
jgi:hypothetical protein